MKKTFLRKLIKFSHYSTCLTLPKIATEALNWDAGSSLEIKLDTKRSRLIVTSYSDKNIKKSNFPEPITLAMENEKRAKPLVTSKDSKSLSKEDDSDLLPLEEL